MIFIPTTIPAFLSLGLAMCPTIASPLFLNDFYPNHDPSIPELGVCNCSNTYLFVCISYILARRAKLSTPIYYCFSFAFLIFWLTELNCQLPFIIVFACISYMLAHRAKLSTPIYHCFLYAFLTFWLTELNCQLQFIIAFCRCFSHSGSQS